MPSPAEALTRPSEAVSGCPAGELSIWRAGIGSYTFNANPDPQKGYTENDGEEVVKPCDVGGAEIWRETYLEN